MKTIIGAAFTSGLALIAPAACFAAQRPPMPSETIDPACVWNWKSGGGIGIWAQDCTLATGTWEVVWNDKIAGFQLKNNGEVITTVLQIFRKDKEAPAAAIVPELKKRGFIPDSEDCVLVPAAMRRAPRTISFFEIRPQGERLKTFEATTEDQIPDPPCPDYGWSTHGVRYFQYDLRKPDTVLYIDEGQDGTFFNPDTITFEDAP